ncbi:MAG: S1 RNA-binding domain-containing protein [Candidatus Cloacimonetes bacterium]|nr:S1 RNA-binding domain-containing protein [Candidatus Cloacimonadota bacterium]
MSDKVQDKKKSTVKDRNEDYLRMLEESFQKSSEYAKGDVIESPITSITDSYIVINLGGKFDAFAEIAEYTDENGKLECQVGDILKGFIIDQNDQGYIIGKSLTKQYVDKDSIRDAFERKIPVQGKVYSLTKGGFNVDILGARAFCPMSQIAVRSGEEGSAYIGKTMDFIIIECSENCRRIVVSHRVLQEQNMEEKRLKAMEKISVGAVVQGKIMRMTSFGAFVDLGGVEGLLHISEIAWVHVVRPQDLLKAGQEVDMKVLEISGEKIALSMKALQPNPFVEAIQDFKEGDVVKCRILRLHNFGAFAELRPGVEGLIPVSEMSRTRNIVHPREILKEGDYVEVQILRLDADTQKISLSLKAMQEDPWDSIGEIIQIGQHVEGQVESSTNFGVFVAIAEGVTGLLPRSRIRSTDSFKTHDRVTLMISAIDKETHRITLDYTDRTPDETIETKPADTHRERSSKGMPESGGSRQRRGGKSRGDDEWRKYANQKANSNDDNPFKDL